MAYRQANATLGVVSTHSEAVKVTLSSGTWGLGIPGTHAYSTTIFGHIYPDRIVIDQGFGTSFPANLSEPMKKRH